jgi:hypothetical protein
VQENFRVYTKKTTDILADFFEFLLVNLKASGISKLEQACKNRKQASLGSALDTNSFQIGTEILSGCGVISSREIGRRAVGVRSLEQSIVGGVSQIQKLSLSGGGCGCEEVVECIKGTETRLVGNFQKTFADIDAG